MTSTRDSKPAEGNESPGKGLHASCDAGRAGPGRRAVWLTALIASLAFLNACDREDDKPAADAGPDATTDAGPDAALDAGADAALDAGPMALPTGARLVLSDKPRSQNPAATASDKAELAKANRTFAYALYAELKGREGNLFLSPYSISAALAMTYAGAQAQTEQQMAQALRFTVDEPALHAAFNAVEQELNSRGKGVAGADGGVFRLNIVNALWGQHDHMFLTRFLDLLAEHYGAGMYLLDFLMAPETSRMAINDWVAAQTERRIRDLIPPGVISVDTRLVLTNAIYFNATWAKPFDEAQTKDSDFTRLDGSKVSVPMMTQTARLPYAAGNGWQAVKLPYHAPELSMVVLVPEAGRFAEVEAALDDTLGTSVRDALADAMTSVSMPRFSFESDLLLNAPLMALGMTDAFAPRTADFSGMDGTRDLFIQGVLHKAFVKVDEAGTEAAAATAVVVGTTSAPPPAQITLDRPFLFLIQDEPTGQVLFLGRVMDPS